jgi:hypothetical protein
MATTAKTAMTMTMMTMTPMGMAEMGTGMEKVAMAAAMMPRPKPTGS